MKPIFRKKFLVTVTALFSSISFAHGEIKPKLHWDHLAKFHDTLTRKEFSDIANVYSPDSSLYQYLKVSVNYIDVYQDKTKTKPALFRLFLAKNTASKKKLTPPFKNFKEIASKEFPLRGLRILIDPGHIGGDYAQMEQRILRREDGAMIQEGALNLKTALLLRENLKRYGAKVYLTKKDLQPLTHQTPEYFRKQAEREISANAEQNTKPAIEKEMDRLFYRESEIRARAEHALRIKPDFTLCIHFNATPATPENPWTEDNRLVIFVHGSYESEEIASEEQRLRLFSKVLENSLSIELALGEKIAKAMTEETKLPPVHYTPSSHYLKVGQNPCLYARNLAANRLFPGPVIYLEPYYQNNPVVFQRLLAGDYEGLKVIEGQSYKSIFREYTDGVTQGILDFFNQHLESDKIKS